MSSSAIPEGRFPAEETLKMTASGSAEHPLHRFTSTQSAADFEEIFTCNVSGLRKLAYLLTGDPALAIGCVAAAMQECVQSAPVHAYYGESLARRAVAKIAIAATLQPDSWVADRRWWDVANMEMDMAADSQNHRPFTPSSLSTMDAMERIVHVLCEVEGYSALECAHLIGLAARQIGEAETPVASSLTQVEQPVALAA